MKSDSRGSSIWSAMPGSTSSKVASAAAASGRLVHSDKALVTTSGFCRAEAGTSVGLGHPALIAVACTSMSVASCVVSPW